MSLTRLYVDDLGWVVYCLDDHWHTIEPEFQDNGASAAPWIRRMLGLDRYRLAWRLHDWLYGGLVPRAVADRAMREALILLGCPRRTAWTTWAFVRLCGRSHYLGD